MPHPFDPRLHRLLTHLSAYHARVKRATLYSIFNQIMDLAPPLLIGLAIDITVSPDSSWLSRWSESAMTQLWILGGLTWIIWALESVFEYLYQREWRELAQLIQRQLRSDVYGHIQALDARWFSKQQIGDLLATLNDDINQLERFFNVGANHIIQVSTTSLTVSVVFFYISPTIALWAMLPIPVILWGSFAFQRAIGPRYASVRTHAAAMSAQLTNTLRGMEEVKSFTGERREIERLDRLSQSYVEANTHAISLSSTFSPLIRMAVVMGFLATLIYGGALTLEGEVAIGAYSVLIFLTQRLLWPLTRLGETVDLYQRALASADRAFTVLDTPIERHEGVTVFDQIERSIELRDIDFAYPDRPHLFQGLNLSFTAGRVTAIVGSTGSGKSSIARLILGLYRPQAGEIYIDGLPLSDLDLTEWRRRVGWVSQSVYLFDGSLKDNIRYGVPEATEQAVMQAIDVAGLSPFIESLDEGIETQVGEGGDRLSGGQRQRVSIARALLKDPEILILDEATSAIDPYTEADIQRALSVAFRGKTVISIAHRLTTITSADHIYVLDDGSVIEEGTHHALYERDGAYRKLWGA